MEFTPQILDGSEPFDGWPGGPVPPRLIAVSEPLPRDDGRNTPIPHDREGGVGIVQRLARHGAIHTRQSTSEPTDGRVVLADLTVAGFLGVPR